MTRVAIIADPLDTQTAGIHTYTRHLVEGFRLFAPELELSVVRPGPRGNQAPDEVIVPISPWLPGHQRIRQVFAIPRVINKLRPDIAIEPAHFGPFRLHPGIRRITVVHDLTPLQHPEWHGWGSRLAHRALLPGVLNKADRVVAVSRQTAADILDRFPRLGCEPVVISPSIDARFVPTEDVSCCSRYSIRQPFLLHVGTLEPRKNLQLLIRAWELYRSAEGAIPVQLVLAGKWGWKTQNLRQLISHSPYHNDIILPGFVPDEDLPALYSAASGVVIPSLYEGFGYPVAEALACGCRVLTSGRAALSEFGHKMLEVFPPDSPEALASLIARTVTASRTQVNETEAAAFRQRYSLQFMIRRWVDLLQELSSR